MAEKMMGWKQYMYDLLDDTLTRDNHGNWAIEASRTHSAVIIRNYQDPANPLVIRRHQLIRMLDCLEDQEN